MTLLPSPRRFLRFSLKAVLLLVLIIAISLGWAMHKVREQGIAIREMSEAGARFAVEYAHGGSWTILERFREWSGEQQPRNALRLKFGGLPWTDAELERLRFGPIASVTDVDLAGIQALTHLEELRLGKMGVTDAGIAHVGRLTKLKSLYLDDTQITDAGLQHLRTLTELQTLSLDRTRVTDAGVAQLQGMPRLRRVSLVDTQVSDAAVADLKKTLSAPCIIENGGGPTPISCGFQGSDYSCFSELLEVSLDDDAE